MAENDSSQEKTEEATPKRAEKAREEGQVARSKELSAAAVLIVGSATLIASASTIGSVIASVFADNFQFQRSELYEVNTMAFHLMGSILTAGKVFVPLFILLFLSALVAPIAMGSWNVSWKALQPKLSRMDPVKGVKKIFSVNGLMEMVKSLAKFVVIAAMGIFAVYLQVDEILGLADEPVKEAIAHGARIIAYTSLIIALSLLIIAVIDVPFQIWNHAKQLKMTKQEVKDEMKDTEGKPEVKSKIRQLQMAMTQQRMMSNVPDADVVITNPTHFSVALRYRPGEDRAPILVAKGADFVALKIREIANHHEITIMEAPPLARAVYYNTEVDQEIPDGLYLAVAQVLAYVFQLNDYKKGKAPRPGPQPDFPVPDEFRRDV